MGWTSLPCLAIGTVSRSSNCELIFLTVPPSYPPWLHGRYPLHRYYGGSDSCLAPSCTKTGILDYQTRTSRHPVSNHPMRPIPGYASCSRSAWPPIRFVGYRRFFGLRASIAVSSVAYRPYRVCMTAPSRADQSTGCLFTSSCSPPHLAVTQLLSVFWREAPPGKDFHLPVRAFSQAHDRGLLGRFEMGIGGSPSTGLGAGCWVVPWSWSRRTMKRCKRRAPNCIVRGALLKYVQVRARGKRQRDHLPPVRPNWNVAKSLQTVTVQLS